MHLGTKPGSVSLIANILLAGLICSLNHWVAIAKTKGDYSPFSVSPAASAMTFDETHAYAPAVQRFMALGRIPAEVDNYERRDSVAGIPYFPAAILGLMGRVFGNAERAFIAADFIFPALAFWLFYASSSGLINSHRLRLVIAWATLLIPWGGRNFFWLGYDSLVAAPDFTRTPQPEISFTIVLSAVLLSARALESSTKLRIAVVAGLLASLVVYSYYFYALAWGMTLAMLFALMLVWKQREQAKRVGLILSIMVLGSIPFVFVTIRGKAEGGQTYLLARMGGYTHSPRLVPLFLFAVGLFLVVLFGKRFHKNREAHIRIEIFILLLLSGLAGLNFQVLTGYDAQHTHYWNRLILPVACFLLGCWFLSAAESLVSNRQRVLNTAAIAVVVCILLNAGIRQVCVGARIAAQQHASRPELELLGWVRTNIPEESVIGSVDPDLILLIPAIGPNFNYVPTGLRSLTATAEIVDRYYELAAFLGLSKAEIESVAIIPYHHSTNSQLLLVLGDAEAPQSFSDGYDPYRQGGLNGRRRLDYIVLASGEPLPSRITRNFLHARVVHSNSQYQLVALR
jgi:hypothetical protein